MSSSSLISLQWKADSDTLWHTIALFAVPVARPVKIRIEAMQDALAPEVEKLVDEILAVVKKAGGKHDAASLSALIEPESNEESVLEMIVCDGTTSFPLADRVGELLKRPLFDHAWVLPAMPEGKDPQTLPKEIQPQNIAFWKRSAKDLALTVLGRAGITSLDRRVFISYRRAETEPMAGQLFDALTKLNYSVFLDTVSVHKGVNFQDQLFEQLADKSMVVQLHSETFSTSQWTIAEVEYARQHDLSVLIFRLPDVKDSDKLAKSSRPADVAFLTEQDLVPITGKGPRSLVEPALAAMVDLITKQHDKAMIQRLAKLRRKTLNALKRHGIVHQPSQKGASIQVTGRNQQKWTVFPTSRPPGVPELYDASSSDDEKDVRRLVVGNVNSFHPMRRKQLDWVVDERNVAYLDVHNLEMWIKTWLLEAIAP